MIPKTDQWSAVESESLKNFKIYIIPSPNTKQINPIILEEIRACLLSHLSRVRLFATLWTAACQAPLSMGFSRHEYWVVSMPSSKGSPDPRIKPMSLMSPALAGRFFTTSATWEAQSGGGNFVFWKAAQVNLRSSQPRISGQASFLHYEMVKRPSRSGLRAYEYAPFCWMTAWKILWRFMALSFVIWN